MKRNFAIILLNIILFALSIILLVSLAGCVEDPAEVPTDTDANFEWVASGKLPSSYSYAATRYDVYYHKKTKVMYMVAVWNSEKSITIMYDAEGKPLIYKASDWK